MHHSPPTLTKTWFHVGPVAAVEAGDWTELDLTHEYWPDDTPMLSRPAAMTDMLAALPRQVRRDALRALRGQMLRSELYALDGTDRQDRPYTVTESLAGVREESPPAAGDAARAAHLLRLRPRAAHHPMGTRHRPDDPVRVHRRTRRVRPGHPTAHGGRAAAVAIRVNRSPRRPSRTWPPPGQPSTPAATTPSATWWIGSPAPPRYEVRNDGTPSVFELRDAVLADAAGNAVSLRVIGHSRTFYDGAPYRGVAARTARRPRPRRPYRVADVRRPLPRRAVRPHRSAGGQSATRLSRPVRRDGLGRGVSRRVPGPDARAGRLRPLRRRRRAGIARRLLHRRRPPPLRRPRSAPGAARPAARLARPVRRRKPRRLRRARPAPHRGDRPGRARHRRRVRPAGAAAAPGHRPQRQHQPGPVLTRRLRHRPFRERQERRGRRHGPQRAHGLRPAGVRRAWPAGVGARRSPGCTTTPTPTCPPTQRDDEIVSVEYSDGFGRLLQTRTQAEDVLFGDPCSAPGCFRPTRPNPSRRRSGGPGNPAPRTT